MSTCKRLLAVTQLTICFCLFNTHILWGDSVKKIHTQFLTEYDFLRIPEIFTGKEFTGSRVIVRSSPVRRGLYFSILNDGDIPIALSGTAIGIVSIIGYSPDIFATPLYGYLLDSYPGIKGHQLIFMILTGFSIIGLITTLKFKKVTK